MSILAFTPHKTGRKKLAQLLADHLGVKATYLGTPSFAYQIADATLDRNWTLYCQMASRRRPCSRPPARQALSPPTRARWR